MKGKQVKDRSCRPFVQIDVDLIGGLTNSEFKIYAQIKRRAGQDGECWESLEHMAQETGNSVGTLKRSLKGLASKGLISKQKRRGETDIYELTPPSEWRLAKTCQPNMDHFDRPNMDQNDPPNIVNFGPNMDHFDRPNMDQNDPQIRSPLDLDPLKEKIKEAFSERRDFLEKPEQREEVSETLVLTTETSNQSSVNPSSLSGIEYVTEGASAVQKFENAFKSRAENPKHCFPQAKLLAEAGAAHLWVGPGSNDYAPELKAGVKAKKRGWEQSHSDADVITYINNKLNAHRKGDIGQIDDLLARFDEGKGILAKEKPKAIGQDHSGRVIPIDRKESRKLSTAQSFLPPALQAKIEQFNAQREAI